MTKEKIMDTQQWRLTEKYLKKEFPFILKLDINQEYLERYSTIYLKIYIDPFVFIELYGGKINPYYFYFTDKNKDVDVGFLQTLFGLTSNDGKEKNEKIIRATKTIEDFLPEEFKIQKLRNLKTRFDIDGYIIPKNLPIPKDTVPPQKEGIPYRFDPKYFFTTTDEAYKSMER
jgi:hypothetical protein